MGLPRGLIWITGASSGIGFAAAELLAKRGWRIAASSRNKERLAELAKRSKLIHPYPLDVANAIERKEVFKKIRSDLGPIDILVNNAGFGLRGAIEEMEADQTRLLFDVNVFAPLALTRLVLPEMRARREGRIIMVSSLVGRVAFPLSGVYSATKFALEGLSDSLRMEVAPWGIKVVIIEPGPIATRFGATAKEQSYQRITSPDSPYIEYYKRLIREGVIKRRYFWGARPVAQAIRDICENPKPKARYPVHPFARWLPILANLLPESVIDKLLSKPLGLDKPVRFI